mgnify:CR=1 FL=1
MNLRLAASRDAVHWWFPDRRPCLDNAPLGDYGGGMLWQSKNLVADGERLYIYYGGADKYIGLATCKLQELLEDLTQP